MSPPRDESVLLARQQHNYTKAESNSEDGKVAAQDLDQVECSMCGDVGLQQELFRCTKCNFRCQHTYCSHSYPKKRSYAGICNWCDKRDELHHIARSRKLFKATFDTKPAKPGRWNNELEMLLEAATLALKKERKLELSKNSSCSEDGWKSKAGSWVNKRQRRILRAKSCAEKTRDANGKVEENCVPKNKDMNLEASTLKKRTGRRYKCILDVY